LSLSEAFPFDATKKPTKENKHHISSTKKQ